MRIVLLLLVSAAFATMGLPAVASDFYSQRPTDDYRDYRDRVPDSRFTSNPEQNEAYEKGMSINALRAWKAEKAAHDKRSDRQALIIGGGVALGGFFIAASLFLSRRRRLNKVSNKKVNPTKTSISVNSSRSNTCENTKTRLEELEERAKADSEKYTFS
ncbi:MAG: hypothetical protein LUG50_06865 [Planctomycetaceae bacterium]|nr:hypothetical protein [Planctomycetaceae bacterium]